jgi:AraC-like DNA-binding protein
MGDIITQGSVALTLVEKREKIAQSGTQSKEALAKIESKIKKLQAEKAVEIEEIQSKPINKEQEKKNILKDYELAKKDILARKDDSIDNAKSDLDMQLYNAQKAHKSEKAGCENDTLAEEARHKAALKAIQDRMEMSELTLKQISARVDMSKKNFAQTEAKIERDTERKLQLLEKERDQQLVDLDNTEKAIQTQIKKCENKYR